jgi:hypothetical protein
MSMWTWIWMWTGTGIEFVFEFEAGERREEEARYLLPGA